MAERWAERRERGAEVAAHGRRATKRDDACPCRPPSPTLARLSLLGSTSTATPVDPAVYRCIKHQRTGGGIVGIRTFES